MAIIKTIQIHDTSGIYGAERYIENLEKTTISQDIINALEYDTNAEKTSLPHKRLVSGYKCSPYFAAQQFRWARDAYRDRHSQANYKSGKRPVEAIHLIMSFDMDIKDPELVHQIGLEFCERLKEKGICDCQAVVSTHMNTRNLHNHILINAYSIDGMSKLHDNATTRQIMRDLNDELSREHGLPVLDHNYVPVARVESLNEKKAMHNGRSWKEMIRMDIDISIEYTSSYAEWKENMKMAGYSIRETNDGIPISVSVEGHHCRLDKLNTPQVRYTYDGIRERIAKNAGVSPDEIIATPPEVPRVYMERVYRYTKDGRRRGNLEMLILKVLTYLKNLAKFLFVKGLMDELERVNKQTADLQKALDIMAKYDLATKTDLKQLQKRCGHNIKQLKDQLDYSDRAIGAIRDHLDNGTVPAIMADIDPMTPMQKKALFQAVGNSDYRCYCKFDMISSTEADQILAFLQGPSEPAVIPGPLTKGYTPISPTREMLETALERAEAISQSSERDLAEANQQYKELKHLEKAIENADGLYEKILADLAAEKPQKPTRKRRPRTAAEPVEPVQAIRPEPEPMDHPVDITASIKARHNQSVQGQSRHTRSRGNGRDI